MCNGETGRGSQGGVIAVLKSTDSSASRPQLRRELSLRLNEDGSTTTATFEGLDRQSSSHIVIHRDGDLRSNAPDHGSALYRFTIPQLAMDGRPFALEHQLDLGAGGEGVIGRRVTVMDHQTVLSEGIIGWN